MLGPRPDYYNEITFGGTSAPEGAADVGGLFGQPNLDLSYLFAARVTLEGATEEKRLRDVVLPIAYLQRHAYELALKDLLGMAYRIAASTAWLAALNADAKAPYVAAKSIPKEHDFAELVNLVRAALSATGYQLPAEIDAVAQRLREIERVMTDEEAALLARPRRGRPGDPAIDPTRTRYAHRADGKPSFPESTELRVEETQTLLEDVIGRVFVYQHHEYENPNLATDIAHEEMGLDQKIVAIVGVAGL